MAEERQKVRVRFAPSPTGYVHLGSLRTALYNFLYAKKHGGDFLLRIEDTDQKRFVPGALENLLSVLTRFGMTPDEGMAPAKEAPPKATPSERYPGLVHVGGYGPYAQSERLALYREKAEGLVAAGLAYYCFCDETRLTEVRERQRAEKTAPRYDRHCLRLSKHEIEEKLAAGIPKVIRLRIPDHERIILDDLVRGPVAFDTENIDDQVLLKSDGFPTYHLASVVDDHLMKITHVMRSEEWLSSTPKHLLLYRAFHWVPPHFAHFPLLLNPDRSKLSKRQGDVAVEDYLKRGYLEEALINFVALLGWNPGEGSVQEVFSLDDLTARFDLAHIHKAGAVFDIQKLDWLNAQYVKRLAPEDLYVRSRTFLETKTFFAAAPAERRTPEYIKKVLAVEQERLSRLEQVGEEHPYLFEEPRYEAALLHWKGNSSETTREALGRARDLFSAMPRGGWERAALAAQLLETAGEKRGDFLWPLRVALSGAKQSPPPGDLAWVLGQSASLERLEQALKKLKTA